jgi:hypothetical protein
VYGNLANSGGGGELGEAESDHSRVSYHKSSALSSAILGMWIDCG